MCWFSVASEREAWQELQRFFIDFYRSPNEVEQDVAEFAELLTVGSVADSGGSSIGAISQFTDLSEGIVSSSSSSSDCTGSPPASAAL